MTCGREDIPLPDEGIPIVIFDLDGTLAATVWPQRREIGPAILEGISLLRHYAGLGYRVEIFTSRPEVDYGAIWAWVLLYNLPVDAVTCGKPFGGLYIDDRGWRPPYAGKDRIQNPPADDDWVDKAFREAKEEGAA